MSNTVKPSITIGYINHNEEVFNKFLGKSLNYLEGNFDIISTTDKNPPSKNYNEIIDKSSNNLIILTHQDISFSSDLIKNIFSTIETVGEDFGALGIVGMNSQGYIWSENNNTPKKVNFLDCCFIVIQKKHGLKFDEENFDDFHLYVEDYCARITQKLGKLIYTINTSSSEAPPDMNIDELLNSKISFANHHSFTLNQRGNCWGRYWEYHDKLVRLWPNINKST